MMTAKIEKSKEYLEKEKQWNTAFAISRMGLPDAQPSEFFWELVEKEKRGEITTDEIVEILVNKYTVKESMD